MTRRSTTLVLVAACAGYVALLADVLLRGRLRRLDLEVLAHTPEVADNWQTHTSNILASLGAWPVQGCLVLGVGVLVSLARGAWLPVLQAAGALALVGLVVGGTKLVVTRPSPWQDPADLVEVGGAFPSGHVAGAVLVGALVPLLATSAGSRARLLLLGLGLTWPILMGVGRLQQYVHWTTDVLGGLLAGAAAVAAVVLVGQMDSRCAPRHVKSAGNPRQTDQSDTSVSPVGHVPPPYHLSGTRRRNPGGTDH